MRIDRITFTRFIKYLVCIIIFFNAQISHAKINQTNMDNLAILVPSCDKYSDLWHPFSELLFKFWPQLQSVHSKLNIYLLSNEVDFVHDRIQNIKIYNDINWSDSIKSALKQIDEKYVLIILEDYFLHTPVNDQHFWDAFMLMQEQDAAYLQVAYSVENPDLSKVFAYDVVQKLPNAEYRTSLQAAIWDKEVLLNLLQSGESAWQFEKEGSVRSEAIERPFLAIIEDPPLKYLNMVTLGVIDVKLIEYCKKNLGVDFGKVSKKLRRSDAFKYRIRPYRKTIIYSFASILTFFIVFRARRILLSKKYARDLAIV